jgi:hypothetical protein
MGLRGYDWLSIALSGGEGMALHQKQEERRSGSSSKAGRCRLLGSFEHLELWVCNNNDLAGQESNLNPQ